jgi:hypothetical protein
MVVEFITPRLGLLDSLVFGLEGLAGELFVAMFEGEHGPVLPRLRAGTGFADGFDDLLFIAAQFGLLAPCFSQAGLQFAPGLFAGRIAGEVRDVTANQSVQPVEDTHELLLGKVAV